MNDFRYLLKYCNCVIFFYLEIKLFYLYVNKTNCVQDEEFLIIVRMENKAGRYFLYIFLNKVNVENKVNFNLKWAMVNENTFDKIIMREITTFPPKWFFFYF